MGQDVFHDLTYLSRRSGRERPDKVVFFMSEPIALKYPDTWLFSPETVHPVPTLTLSKESILIVFSPS